MRALLDVNVLVALLDRRHLHHDRAHAWLAAHIDDGWASCPMTQNGVLRVMSQPAYPGELPVGAIAQRLGEAASTAHHEAWHDDVSLLDRKLVDTAKIHGPRQVTDVYLLALAVAHCGRFVTLDRRVPLSPVHGAASKHLVII